LLTRINCCGTVEPAPEGSLNAEYPVAPAVVVTEKLELLARLKPISLEEAVVIVFPLLYAACKFWDEESHFTSLFEESTQVVEPAFWASPVKVNEPPVKFIAILLPLPGVRETGPVVVNFLPEPKAKSVLIVVVPLVAPSEIAVAPPPIFKFVEPLLKRLTVVSPKMFEVELLPWTVNVPLVVTAPVNCEAPSIVSVPLAWMLPVLSILTPVDV